MTKGGKLNIKTDYDSFNRSLDELGSNLHYSREDTKLDNLFLLMNTEGVGPFEYMDWVYKISPEMLCKNAMCSEKTWYDFLEFRGTRQAENKIKSELQKLRLYYLLKEEKEGLEDIVNSTLESFFVYFRYIMACMLNDEKLKDEFRAGAIYELRTMPELRELFKEFEGQHDLKEEVWTNGGHTLKE
jgi:hypothetical protein